jgi:hypothetical protein
VTFELLFWPFFVAWLVVLFLSVRSEVNVLAVISSIAYLCLLQFLYHVDIIKVIEHHPFQLVGLLLLYFVLGGAWSVFRWFLFVRDKVRQYLDMRNKWLQYKGQTQFKYIPDELKEEWTKYLEEKYVSDGRKDLTKPPLVRDHKYKIMGWIGWWPISAGLWMLEDLVKGVARSIYEYLHDWLQDISNRMFASVRQDLPENFK